MYIQPCSCIYAFMNIHTKVIQKDKSMQSFYIIKILIDISLPLCLMQKVQQLKKRTINIKIIGIYMSFFWVTFSMIYKSFYPPRKALLYRILDQFTL